VKRLRRKRRVLGTRLGDNTAAGRGQSFANSGLELQCGTMCVPVTWGKQGNKDERRFTAGSPVRYRVTL